MAEESLSSWPNPYWWWTSFAAWWLGDVPCWLQMVLPLGWRQAVVMGKGEPCLVASALPTRGIRGHGLAGERSGAKPLVADPARRRSVFCLFDCTFPINEEVSFPAFLFQARRTQLYLHIIYWCQTKLLDCCRCPRAWQPQPCLCHGPRLPDGAQAALCSSWDKSSQTTQHKASISSGNTALV